ncbi:MAG: response regulator transcription factor [Jaaginema sp. PMC 1079.18]|nr:response regulator transcription factor [Jaaginema sp. PMC 1080.18]MEC4853387.1 response regulator transcription factor [Jaaginema sp. PMC 1079.18]MEC4867998.1 response regulator transcription factor [Jaaginema sp. PMC 1078.18]
MRILLVEDDRQIAQTLAAILRQHHYTVDLAEDGEMGLNYAQTYEYDLILLDLMLPKRDGFGVCQELRRRGDRVPILMLTARDASSDQVLGLDAGADDYVVKPFAIEPLLARIRALLRRGNVAFSPVLTWENLHLDPSTCIVKYRDKILPVTPKEYALLELLLRSPHRVLSRGLILEHLWDLEDQPREDAVKVHLRRLRQKLKAAGAPPNLIETVYGIGYRLNPNF